MIPRAFRIRDFRSIVDSGVCPLSGDNITAIAGQNESGKTAILCALRDFDLPVGEQPQTSDFMPEGRDDAIPRVAIKFKIDFQSIWNSLSADGKTIPEASLFYLESEQEIWIERNMQEGKFALESHFEATWCLSDKEGKSTEVANQDAVQSNEITPTLLSPSEFAAFLRDEWPQFVYFETFENQLPKEVFVDEVVDLTERSTPKIKKGAKKAVLDFVTLSEIDLTRLVNLLTQDKALGNYLDTRAARITGDFLTYWTQNTDGQQKVDLIVKHSRDVEGKSKLLFFVHDKTDQYPEQRSKGFLWFLSFYLSLAAAEKREPERTRLLLIDEPGSYLHMRAQRDILKLFEDRLAKTQQIIYSTHSPYLLPPDKLYRLRLVIKNGEKGTQVIDRLQHPDLQGEQLRDTLSPVLTAIGVDISSSLSFVKPYNVITEGPSDHTLITTWAKLYKPDLLEKINVFPGTGASTLPTFASLFIGWGLKFIVVLDRDEKGDEVRERLLLDYGIDNARIIQPSNSVTIEDLFSIADFTTLVKMLHPKFVLKDTDRPSKSIKKLDINKVLLARKFAEASTNGFELDAKSKEAVAEFVQSLYQAAIY